MTNIDDLCCGKECVPVYVNLNSFKDDGASAVCQLVKSFVYTSSNVPGPTPLSVDPNEVEYSGCSCRLQSCLPTCPCIARFGPNYTSHGTLIQPEKDSGSKCSPEPEGKPVFECNASCLCGDNCTNRVVQNGVHHKMEVFHAESKGWGLRALETIEKGSFVCEYAGEVLVSEEAMSRMASMKENDMNYIFALRETFGDGVVKTSTTYIDARLKGSIARFINHSCEPNLYPVAVRVHNEIPRIALFAQRDIEIGEEFSYHYDSGDVARQSRTQTKTDIVKSTSPQKPCHCGSLLCLKYLPYNALTKT